MNTTQGVRSEVVSVSPMMARHLRQTCHFERQRNINARNVERLSIEMQRGRFVPGTQVYLGVLPDRSMLILNGNHTLEAIADSGVSIPLTMTYMPVADINDAGRIYARFDLQRLRTWDDAIKAVGANLSVGLDWQRRLGAAVGHIMQRFTKKSREVEIVTSRDLRLRVMAAYDEVAVLLVDAIKSAPVGNQKFMRRLGIMSVALETFKYQPVAAREFWEAFAKDDGLSRDNPAKALLEYCRNNNADTDDRRIQSNAAALAWNAFFKGRKLTQVKAASMGEFRLLGTPWAGDYDPLPDLGITGIESVEQPASGVAMLFETGIRVGANGVSEPVSMAAASIA